MLLSSVGVLPCRPAWLIPKSSRQGQCHSTAQAAPSTHKLPWAGKQGFGPPVVEPSWHVRAPWNNVYALLCVLVCRVAEGVFDYSSHYDHLMEAAQEMAQVCAHCHTSAAPKVPYDCGLQYMVFLGLMTVSGRTSCVPSHWERFTVSAAWQAHMGMVLTPSQSWPCAFWHAVLCCALGGQVRCPRGRSRGSSPGQRPAQECGLCWWQRRNHR